MEAHLAFEQSMTRRDYFNETYACSATFFEEILYPMN